MLQKSSQSQKSRNISKQKKQQIGLDDLSITSQQDDESEEEICEGEFFKSSFGKQDERWKCMYPDSFQQYPNSLVVRLSKFIRGFRRHPVAKLLHYELNCALLIYQISYKLTRIKKHYEGDKSTSASYKLLEYYLKLQSISNLCKLLQMVKILMNKTQINQQWGQQRKASFMYLKSNKDIRIKQGDGMNLLLAIDNFTYTIVENCSQLKYMRNYIPYNLKNIDYDFFDNLPKPLECRIKLVPKQEDIVLPKIQQHFQDLKLQKQFHQCNKAYFSKLYKQIHYYYLTNSNDPDLNQLLYFIIVVKIAGDNLPFKLFSYIQNKKAKLVKTVKISENENFHQIVTQSNLHLRAQISKLHFLIKNRGFMKLLSFVHESEISDIQQEIAWCYNAKTNLN